jgi:diguanylate cyclase (GGDEF)-like protein
MASYLPQLQRRAWLAALAAGAGLAAVFFALTAGSVEQTSVYDLIGLAAVVAALAALALHRPISRMPWLLMGAGQLAFVVGDVLWTVYTVQGEEPFPSVADIAYLAGYPLIAIGLTLAIRRRIAGGDRASLLDAAILATGASVAWWAVVLGPLAATLDPEPLAFAISLAYPIGDLVLLGMALTLAVTPGAKGVSFRLLVLSLVVVLAGDLVFNVQSLDGTYVEGGWLDGLWLLGYTLFAAAALHPSMAELVEPRPVTVTLLGPVRLVLLGIAMLVGPGLLMLQRSTTDAIVVVVATETAALSVLVLARLTGMVRHLASDIERRKALEAQLAFQAFHDPLTGLANRRRFIVAADHALDMPGPTAALFIDLDDFKLVNDNMGHDAGDALLLAIGERLLASVRPGDLVGRLGGDEFAVLLETVEAPDVPITIASRLVETLASPVEIEGTLVKVSASVGLAIRARGERQAVDDLLRRADVAMYHAKARGKNRWAAYAPSMEADEPVSTPSVRRSIPAA